MRLCDLQPQAQDEMGILGEGGMGIAPMPAFEQGSISPIENETEPNKKVESNEGVSTESAAAREEPTTRRNQRATQKSIEAKFGGRDRKRNKEKNVKVQAESEQEKDAKFRATVTIDEHMRQAIYIRLAFCPGETINSIINDALRVELERELELAKSPAYAKIRSEYGVDAT